MMCWTVSILLVVTLGYANCQEAFIPKVGKPVDTTEKETNLPRRDPGKVGDTSYVTYEDGRVQKLITRATQPPIFELPNFLSSEECKQMIGLAKKKGLHTGSVFKEKGSTTEKSRVGKTTFIPGHKEPLLRKIQNRAIALTGLSENIVYHSEDFQFGLYNVGGFYHFHYDSLPRTREQLMDMPCCQHAKKPHTALTCTICRYVTILMYLNQVEEGGGTAFPLADKPGLQVQKEHDDLNATCENAPVVVKPELGKAVFWYNNIIDPEHGWLGVHDFGSLHGGCPILKGHKWISNLWIDAPQYHSKNKKTIYHDEL